MGYIPTFDHSKYKVTPIAPGTMTGSQPGGQSIPPVAPMSQAPMSVSQGSSSSISGGSLVNGKFIPQDVAPEQKNSFMKGNFLSKALDLVSSPLYALGGYTKGLSTATDKTVYEKYGGNRSKLSFGEFLSNVPKALASIPEGIKNKISPFSNKEGNVNTALNYGVTNPYAQAGLNLAGELAAPSIPFGLLAKGFGKIAGKIPGVASAVEKTGQFISTAARNTPAIYKAAEVFNPFFRNPEVGKAVKQLDETIATRQGEVYNLIRGLSKDLSPAEQQRIGQILEGGITTNDKFAKIAAPVRELLDKIGQEAVDAGILNPESYAKYKGKYLTHIFEQLTTEGANKIQNQSLLPKVIGNFFKQRKGAEGYIKEFAPAAFKGASQEVRDIETAKFLKGLVDKHGVKLEPQVKTENFISQLLDVVRTAPKLTGRNLGDAAQPGFRTPQNIAQDLLDYFRKTLPASLNKNSISMGTKGTLHGVRLGKVEEGLPEVKQVLDKFGGFKFEGQKIPEGFVKVPDRIANSSIGKLVKDSYVPKEIADYMESVLPKVKAGGLEEFYTKALSAWKAGKTVFNPAYYVRNALSNVILSDMSTGRGIPRTILDQIRSTFNLAGKGDQSFVNAAKGTRLVGNTGAAQAMDEFLGAAGKELGTKQGFISKAVGKLAGVQTKQEEISKLGVFKDWVGKFAKEAKISIEEALGNEGILKAAKDKAEEAIFSPYRIGKNERDLASKFGIPFYSFTRQAAPFFAKTLANNPNRITKYRFAKDAIESLSRQPGGDQRPGYAEDFIKTPIKNKDGKNVYADPTYIYPWGNFDTLGGDKGQLPFGLSMNPFVSELYQQLNNYDPYFNRPVTESNIPGQQIADRAKHLYRTVAPAAAVTATEKLIPALQGKKDYLGRTRDKVQSLFDAIGFKSSAYTPGELRSKADAEKLKQFRSIAAEEENILKDQSLNPQDKAKKIRELRKVYQNR